VTGPASYPAPIGTVRVTEPKKSVNLTEASGR